MQSAFHKVRGYYNKNSTFPETITIYTITIAPPVPRCHPSCWKYFPNVLAVLCVWGVGGENAINNVDVRNRLANWELALKLHPNYPWNGKYSRLQHFYLTTPNLLFNFLSENVFRESSYFQNFTPSFISLKWKTRTFSARSSEKAQKTTIRIQVCIVIHGLHIKAFSAPPSTLLSFY